MYQLQYWHESLAEWRGAGYWSDDRDSVLRRMRGASEECGHCVRFRIFRELDPLAELTPEEYERACTPV